MGLPLAASERAIGLLERDGEEVMLGVGEIDLSFGEGEGCVVERGKGPRRGELDAASSVGRNVDPVGVRHAGSSIVEALASVVSMTSLFCESMRVPAECVRSRVAS